MTDSTASQPDQPPAAPLIGLATAAVVIVNMVFAIVGGVRVNSGASYRYPVNYRWIK